MPRPSKVSTSEKNRIDNISQQVADNTQAIADLGGAPISGKYSVFAGGAYPTIQSAINAAEAAGFNSNNPAYVEVYHKGVAYVEDLSLKAGINLVGVPAAFFARNGRQFPAVQGTHTFDMSNAGGDSANRLQIASLNFFQDDNALAKVLFNISGNQAGRLSIKNASLSLDNLCSTAFNYTNTANARVYVDECFVSNVEGVDALIKTTTPARFFFSNSSFNGGEAVGAKFIDAAAGFQLQMKECEIGFGLDGASVAVNVGDNSNLTIYSSIMRFFKIGGIGIFKSFNLGQNSRLEIVNSEYDTDYSDTDYDVDGDNTSDVVIGNMVNFSGVFKVNEDMNFFNKEAMTKKRFFVSFNDLANGSNPLDIDDNSQIQIGEVHGAHSVVELNSIDGAIKFANDVIFVGDRFHNQEVILRNVGAAEDYIRLEWKDVAGGIMVRGLGVVGELVPLIIARDEEVKLRYDKNRDRWYVVSKSSSSKQVVLDTTIELDVNDRVSILAAAGRDVTYYVKGLGGAVTLNNGIIEPHPKNQHIDGQKVTFVGVDNVETIELVQDPNPQGVIQSGNATLAFASSITYQWSSKFGTWFEVARS